MKYHRDYYLSGGHIYEFAMGRGRKRAKLCYQEEIDYDGILLWHENTRGIDIDIFEAELKLHFDDRL